MRQIKLVMLLFVIPIALSAQDADSLVDNRDGKVYKIKQIGNNVWMAENLNFEMAKSWCYKKDPSNCSEFGRLYYWDAAIKACPIGWHLATEAEWQELEKHLGMDEKDLGKVNQWRGTDQGTALLSDTAVGFNIKLGGYKNPPTNYYLKGMQAFFWTATEQNGQAFMRQFYNKSPQVFRNLRPKSWGYSVRCVKDVN